MHQIDGRKIVGTQRHIVHECSLLRLLKELGKHLVGLGIALFGCLEVIIQHQEETTCLVNRGSIATLQFCDVGIEAVGFAQCIFMLLVVIHHVLFVAHLFVVVGHAAVCQRIAHHDQR